MTGAVGPVQDQAQAPPGVLRLLVVAVVLEEVAGKVQEASGVSWESTKRQPETLGRVLSNPCGESH